MLWAVVGTALCALLLQPVNVHVMTQLAVIDHPNARSSHELPTPRAGGLVVVLAVVVGLALSAAPPSLLGAIVLFAVLGLAEDVRGVPVPARFALQLCAGALVATTIASGMAQSSLPGWVLVVTMTGWLVAFVNVFNFMDGINGISAGQAIAAGLGYALLGSALDATQLLNASLILATAGACFLPWNAVRARIFLGDVGSYGLGAALGILSVYALIAGATLEAAVAPLALYLADTTWTLVRRIRAGEAWLSAHRSHVYQRLTVLGWSHWRVASMCAALTAALTALGRVSVNGSTGLRVAADLAALALLGGYLAAPRLLKNRDPA